MSRDPYEPLSCSRCFQAAILTDEGGLCPRCYYRLECEAICAAATSEVDRVLCEEDAQARAPEATAAAEAWSW